jgi:hypothetical protein
VVLGELYYGAQKSAKAAENVARLDAFAEHVNSFETLFSVSEPLLCRLRPCTRWY